MFQEPLATITIRAPISPPCRHVQVIGAVLPCAQRDDLGGLHHRRPACTALSRSSTSRCSRPSARPTRLARRSVALHDRVARRTRDACHRRPGTGEEFVPHAAGRQDRQVAAEMNSPHTLRRGNPLRSITPPTIRPAPAAVPSPRLRPTPITAASKSMRCAETRG